MYKIRSRLSFLYDEREVAIWHIANITDPGEKFEKVPNVCIIFICKFDLFGADKSIYHIDRIVKETGECACNGFQEVYVNACTDDGSDIAKLMRIYTETDTYDFERFPKCSARKKQFKMTEKGEKEMCEIIEEYANERAAEAAAIAAKEATKKVKKEVTENAIKKMLARGDSLSDILEIYPEYDETMVLRIKNQM